MELFLNEAGFLRWLFLVKYGQMHNVNVFIELWSTAPIGSTDILTMPSFTKGAFQLFICK
jgi:hypothetical protein